MNEEADVTSLLASRICHDLVSPVGAIVNGTDLIREIGGGDVHEEMAMISHSATRASALLQFYRIAFGDAKDDDATLSRATLEVQAGRMLASPKMQLEWEGLDGPPMTRAAGQLLFQLLMCARAVAGMRGRIAARLDLEESFPMSISVLSLGAMPDGDSMNHDLLRLLSAPPGPDDVTARHVEFALVHRTADALGARITVSAHGEGARIEAARP